MKRIIERLKEVRSESAGFTLVEAMVTILLLGLISIGVTHFIVQSTQTAWDFNSKSGGIQQGPVADKVTEIYTAAEKFVDEHPDEPLTKDALVSGGYVSIPADFTWTVGRYGVNDGEVCAVGYSASEQTDKFTASFPAEHSTRWGFKPAALSSGCWYRNEDKKKAPNWNQVAPVPAYASYTTAPTEGA